MWPRDLAYAFGVVWTSWKVWCLVKIDRHVSRSHRLSLIHHDTDIVYVNVFERYPRMVEITTMIIQH